MYGRILADVTILVSVVKRLTHQTVNLTVQVRVLSLTLEMNCSHAGILFNVLNDLIPSPPLRRCRVVYK